MYRAPISILLRWMGSIFLGILLSCGCTSTYTSGRSGGEARPDLEGMFPSWCPEGWQLSDPPTVYLPSNLYDYINGQAELYLAYGFRRLVTGSFVNAAPEEFIVVDVYDMGEKLNAFGIYSVYEDEGRIPLDAGAAGLRGDRFFALYRGPYFVLITAETADPTVGEHLTRRIARSIPGDTDAPLELGYLPEDGLIQGSLNYTPEGLLGYAFLPRGIEGRYRIGESPVTLFVVFCRDASEAHRALRNYRTYIEQEGGSPASLDGWGEEAFFGKEPYHGGLVVVRSGRFFVGVRDLDESSGLEEGRAWIQRMLERIHE